MNTKTFTHIIGEVNSGEVATIRFFGKITEQSTSQFNSEFDYLENVVKPSLIRVLINSEGGSVLYGMNTFSTIQNSTIPTECIVEGIAASMGSVIWAAGNRSYMRDYSILMIHFPRLPNSENSEAADLINAFANQIKTIYRKRFGLSDDHVLRLMEGDEGKDGTFFDAMAAVRSGIIPESHVLQTSKQLCEKVRNELKEMEDWTEIQSKMNLIIMEADHFKQSNPVNRILNQKDKDNINQPTMTDNKMNSPEYSAVVASLGLKDGQGVQDVMARISELTGVEAKLKETETALSDAKTVIAGKEATITNLQKDLQGVTASLSAYQQKEQEAKKAQIETLVEAAINDGKIDRETKGHWVEMCESNLSLAESILASIPAREQITKEIANDPENIQAAAAGTQTTEEKLAQKVKQVVGENFEFKSLT